MNIGNNIKKIRELKNLSQNYMAEQLEVSQKTYSNIENSGNDISFALVEKIATIFKISVKKVIELNTDVMLSDVQETHLSDRNEIPAPNSSMHDITKELYE